jgi:uncharacterized protein (DUF433 family)
MNGSSIVGAFSEEQVQGLSGLSKSQLKRWRRDGFIRPSFDAGEGHGAFSHIYSFKDLVNLRVLNALRNVHRVSLIELKKTARELAHLGDDKWTATTLYVLKRRVVYVEPETKQKREVTSGQYVADIPLRVAIANTRDAVARMNRRNGGQVGKVVRSRYVNRNAPVVAGTRIPVRVIKDFADAGFRPRQIIKEYPTLTVADVKAAVAFEDARAA